MPASLPLVALKRRWEPASTILGARWLPPTSECERQKYEAECSAGCGDYPSESRRLVRECDLRIQLA